MARYVALLRGVSPLNARMPELKAAFESAGFKNVRTVLSSGNVAFDAPSSQREAALEQRSEQAMQLALGRAFSTIVRSQERLHELLRADPFAANGIPPEAKRVISFLKQLREPKVALPLAQDQASVFRWSGLEVFTAYVPTAKGPVFMQLIERAFGKDVTTRTVDTVRKCAVA